MICISTVSKQLIVEPLQIAPYDRQPLIDFNAIIKACREVQIDAEPLLLMWQIMLNAGSALKIHSEPVGWKSLNAVQRVQQPHHHLALMRSKPRLLTGFGYHAG